MADENQDLNLDLSYLNEVSGGNAEFMIEMIDIFLEQTPLYFNQLGQAIRSADWKGVGDAAHKIKPTLAFMGAEQAKEDMQKLEKNARTLENLETIQPEYERIEALCNRLYSKLEAYKTELSNQL